MFGFNSIGSRFGRGTARVSAGIGTTVPPAPNGEGKWKMKALPADLAAGSMLETTGRQGLPPGRGPSHPWLPAP